MQLLKHTKYWIVGLALLILVSCNKDYYQYEKYISKGPIVYPGRADSVIVLAGKERVRLSWAVPSDLNIMNYKVFWNFGTDSLSVPGRTPVTGDSVKIYVDKLAEGSYSFTVHSYDKEGRRSVGSQAFGNVYGPIFSSTVYNRPIRTANKNTVASRLEVAWVGLDAKCIGTEWQYTDTDGGAARLFSPIGDSTIIPGCNVAQPISYRSLFLPETKAIDTFFTEFKSL
jgi:hypothetical protein